ncbi:enoyl-CoA hydratase/isomerase family protein [Yangia mangrovi]|uniref:3-hydroxyisobutyryl-CoA hydrolase n=1 Tax=Alloyangia mangrovi TaxID=1779329 RepID=A0A2A3JUP0_9RHOB|nr:enoyl-CoA hydratase/isomerase family protein [Alloyangia mangrovi]MCT4369347.1 enoyl-CoA hydratase/isomerase family protein [Alloyangia mangrovi]
MTDILTRKTGRAGHITLTRPKALNALSWEMCLEAEKALDAWAEDPEVALVILDATGERAFCAGGDIAEMYRRGLGGDLDFGRRFWADEYRMNAKLAAYPKPIVAFMHGFIMGGGVGLGGHCSHRVVGESAQVAMPECGIGFVPDVGGSYLLARAPGRLGAHLALTAARMGPGDAIHAGFADLFMPEESWPLVKDRLIETGEVSALEEAARPAPASPMAQAQAEIDALYSSGDLGAIEAALASAESDLAQAALKQVRRNSPLSMAVTLAMLDRLGRAPEDIRAALAQEYRVAHRIMQQGDFLEGVRAQLIDKDRTPRWSLPLGGVPEERVAALLAPLGEDELAL